MSKECKLTIALVLAVALAVYCAALVTISNFEHGGVITIDTFIGAGVGIVGVCATIMVGLQIWNHIEFKEARDKIKMIDIINANIEQDRLELEKLNNIYKKQLGSNFVAQGMSNDNMDIKALSYICSIVCDNWDLPEQQGAMNKSGALLGRYSHLKLNLKDNCNAGYISLYYDEFRSMEIPKEYSNYTEISQLHFEMLGIMDKIIQNDKNTEQSEQTKDAQPK